MPKKRTRVSLVCEQCAKTFERKPSEIARGVSKFCSNRCSGLSHTVAVDERFWCKVSKDGPTPERYPELGQCWDWTGALSAAGYGLLNVNGVSRLASRIALTRALGRPLVRGEHALHVCDRPSCVRDDTIGTHLVNGVAFPRFGHLFLGTPQANGLDMSQKGRQWLQAAPERVKRGDDFIKPPGWTKRGEDKPNALLTEAIVRDIRRLRAEGLKLREIAAIHGIHLSTVSLVATRKSWSHV